MKSQIKIPLYIIGSMLLLAFVAPEKLINKTISKVWKEEITKKQITIKDSTNSSIGEVYELYKDEEKAGYACFTTAFGCKIGGCAKPNEPNALTYETFDYIVLFDTNFVIQRLEIANYPGAYGYQICKPKWLQQFVGQQPSIKLNEDIDGISGATISAQFLVDDVNALKDVLEKSID